jgi:hypothetical protein
MMTEYIFYIILTIVWITGVYFWFNRKKSTPENELSPPDANIIATTGKESRVRIIFDQGDRNNMDIKSLADFTVRYSDLISGNYIFPGNDLLTEKIEEPMEQKTEEAEDLDMRDYINIFTIKIFLLFLQDKRF